MTFPLNQLPTIVQWNCNGFLRHISDIQLLLKKYDPFALCIQESRYKTLAIPQMKSYQCFFKNSLNINHAAGGVLTCIQNNVKCEKISLNTHFQAVAVTIFYPFKHTICNIYK